MPEAHWSAGLRGLEHDGYPLKMSPASLSRDKTSWMRRVMRSATPLVHSSEPASIAARVSSSQSPSIGGRNSQPIRRRFWADSIISEVRHFCRIGSGGGAAVVGAAKPLRRKKRTCAEQGLLAASNPNRETPSPAATHFEKLQLLQANQYLDGLEA